MDSVVISNVRTQKDHKSIQVDPITLLITEPVNLQQITDPQISNKSKKKKEQGAKTSTGYINY